MGRAEAGLESEKEPIATPVLGEEIGSFMQTNALDGQLLRGLPVNVSRQDFSRDRLIRQAGHFTIQILMVELAPEQVERAPDSFLKSTFAFESDPGPVIVSVTER